MAVPVGIILVSAFMQVIELNSYWKYFLPVVLAVCFVFLCGGKFVYLGSNVILRKQKGFPIVIKVNF